MSREGVLSELRARNLLRLQGEIAAGLDRLSARPLELFLEVSDRCPCACIHCPTPARNAAGKAAGYLDFHVLERLRPWMDTFARIYLTGEGEPASHPRFREILSLCLSGGAEVSFVTSGHLLDPDTLRLMVDQGLAHVRFSVDAAEPALHERIRRRVDFHALRRNVKRLARLKKQAGTDRPFIETAAVLMDMNADQAPRLVELAEAWGANQVRFQPLEPRDPEFHGRAFFRRESLSAAAYHEAVERARARGAALGVAVEAAPPLDAKARAAARVRSEEIEPRYAVLTMDPPAGATGSREDHAPLPGSGPVNEAHRGAPVAPPPPTCTQPWTTLRLRWDGRLFPCERASSPCLRLEPWTRPVEAWNAPALRRVRRALAAGRVPEECLACAKAGGGRDALEELTRTVLPGEAPPAAAPSVEPKPALAALPRDPEAFVLGLSFTPHGTALAMASKGKLLLYLPLERVTGLVPTRFISRLAPPSRRGEFFLEDDLFLEVVDRALGSGKFPAREGIPYLAYNPDPALAGPPGHGRNPALEERFPNATPVVVPPRMGHMGLAFFTASFRRAGLLVVEEGESLPPRSGMVIHLGRGEGRAVAPLLQLAPPHDPGPVLAAALRYLALGVSEAQQISGFAAAGTDRLVSAFRDEVTFLDEDGFRFREEGWLHAVAEAGRASGPQPDPVELLEERFGPRRHPGEAPAPHHLDVARGVHRLLADLMVCLAKEVHRRTGLEEICLSGCPGIADVLPDRILAETAIHRVHVPAECSGLGLAAGNALFASIVHLGADRPEGRGLAQVLSTPALPPPSPEARERYRNAALSTLRRQHERLVWAWHGEQGREPASDRGRAAELLARQNEHLLILRLEALREIEHLRKRLGPRARLRPPLGRYARDKAKGLFRRLRGG